MNSGLINGPVQAQKNGRWRRWEYVWPGSHDVTPALAPAGFSLVVPVPTFVSVVRVTAIASSIGNATTESGGGGACKNVLLSLQGGRQLVAYNSNFNGQVVVGVLRAGLEISSNPSISNHDWSIRLTSGVGNPVTGGSAHAVRRGVDVVSAVGGSTPTLRPFNGGSLVSGYGTSTAPNPIIPQIRFTSGSTWPPSILFGGPFAAGETPGSGQQTGNTDLLSPAYVLVEWME